MGKIGKRVLSAVVALVMCIAVLPTNISFAATDVYTKVTSADDIVDGGKYVLATLYEETYKAVAGTADGSNAMDAVAVDVSGDQITNPSTDLVWTLEAGTGGFYLVNNAGSKLSCGSSGTGISLNSTGITWAFNVSGGLFNIVPSTQSTRQLMYRISSDQYRAYAQSNLGASDDGNSITVFKLDTAVEPEYTDIADVRAYETGVSATVQGTVTFIDGRNVYIQDSTGGIDLYLNSGTVPSTLAIGDKVQATGTTAEYRGLFELSGIDGNNAEVFNVISTGNELPLAEVTLAELASDEDTTIQLMESTRVLIKGLTLGTINTSGSTPVTDAYGNSINIYKMPETSFVEGDIVDVIAIVSSFNVYQLRVASASDITAAITLPADPTDHDPITTIPENVLNIKQANQAASSEEITVIGQVAYKFAGNTIILQDLIDNEIIGLQVYDYSNFDSYVVGDVVTVSGTTGVYGGVKQISNVTDVTVTDTTQEPFPAQELLIAQLQLGGDKYVSEYVVLRDATLGTYSASGNTSVTQGTYTTNIYKGAAFPEGIVAGDVVDIYAAQSKYVSSGQTTYQLRVGSSEDYVNTNVSYTPIADVRAYETGVSATVQGTVTFIDGRNVYIQDSTGGIDLYLNSGTVPSTLAIGDKVQATGTTAEYRGLFELSGIDGNNAEVFNVISTGNELPLAEVTLAELASDEDTTIQLMESTRVLIKGLTLGTINTSGSTPVTDAYGNSINIYKMPETSFVEGDIVDVIAIVSSFNVYQLRVASASDITETLIVDDPISDEIIPENVLNINEALAAVANEQISVIGQLVYRYGNYDSMNSAILQDVINGEIVAIQLYNSLDDYDIGDIVVVTGTKSVYGGVPQVQSLTATTLVKPAAETTLIPAQEFTTIASMLENKATLLSEWVLLREVTLGEYNSNGTTYVADSMGTQIGIYRAASYPTGVTAGEVVDLYACLSAYNTTTQLRVGSQTDYVVLNDTSAPVVEFGTLLDAEVGKDYTVNATITDNVGVVSASLECTFNGGTSATTTYDMTYNETTGKYECVIPGSSIVVGVTSLSLTINALDEANNNGTASTTVTVNDLPRITSVQPEPNSATYDDKRPNIIAVFENAGENPTVEMYLDGMPLTDVVVDGETATYTPASNMEDGKYTAKVVITRSDNKSCELVWTFTVGQPQYSLYFGQIHSHTAEYSDGAGTLEDAFEYVMNLPDSENVDFLAVTDHSNYFDTASNLGNFADASAGKLTADGTQTLWQEAKTTTAHYNSIVADKVFCYGFEMTWSGQYGHMNIYNTVGFESRNNPDYVIKGGPGLTNFYNRLKQFPNALGMFNHPGTTFGTFEDFAHWDPAIDSIVTMIEVGNGEGQVGGGSYWPSYEYYTLALDKGWHVAPTNNQDNHKGKWGNANTTRTVVLTDNFTEEGIYQAMRDRAIYSTEDHNLEIMYTLNNMPMGSIIDATDNVHIYASISDPNASDVIGLVSVVVNGGVTVYTQEFNSNTGILDVTLPSDYSYYYIRVDQADGDIAVTAPVWTGEVSKVGISSVTKDTVIEVKGEPTTVTTKIYNYETSDMTVDSIVYSLRIGQGDFTILDTVENPITVTTMTENETPYVFTPTTIGAQTLKVTVYATLGTTPYVFTYNMDLDVLDPTELIDVAIDAGHSNFYISGNYAGSDAAFIELCAKNGIRVEYITDDITSDALADKALLVLTVPYGGWQTVGVENLYTQDELDAIKYYADNGGNVIVCSKSDRGNPTAEEEMAHNISNAILEAIGATSRVANGIVVDEVEKENEAYRLYFDTEYNYNYDSPFLYNVFETTNNSFSCYNGAPIIPGANATEIIQGFTSTWGANYTADFGGSSSYVPVYAEDTVVVPKDEVSVMVSETLPGGGWLLVSGVTFFSTFEVSVTVENSTTLQNSNYQIVMNIINMLKPEPTITPIADVHAAEEGVRFTIEGIVTSNASGYDQDTAFFDCIYVQDVTGGINLFPVDGNFCIGQKVRVQGTTSSYNGERQLAVSTIECIDEMINPVEPTLVTCAEAMSPANTGKLLKVVGAVQSLGYSSDGALETIMVEDSTGVARVFIDGYIMSEYTGLDDIAVGDDVEAIGLGSITVDTEDVTTADSIPRMRVRNRSEITYSTPVNCVDVTISHNEFGTTTPAAGTYEVEVGSEYTVGFTANADCELVSVLVNSVEAIDDVVDGALTLTIDEATEIEAVFAEIPPEMVDVTISHNEFGTTTPAAGTYEVEVGSEYTVGFTANEGCGLISVLVNGVDMIGYVMDNALTLTIDEATEIEAIFAENLPNTVNVTIYHNECGTTTPAAGTYIVEFETPFTITMTPDEGYMVQSVLVDGFEMITSVVDGTITLTPVTDVIVEVTFVQIPKTGVVALTSFAIATMLSGAAIVIFKKKK